MDQNLGDENIPHAWLELCKGRSRCMTDAVEALRIAFMGTQCTGNGSISGILWELVGII